MARTPKTEMPDDQPLTYLAEAITTIGAISAMGLETKPHPAGGEVLIIPDGYREVHLQGVNPPVRDHVVAKVTLTDLASFVAYVNDFKTEGATRVFLDASDHPAITAILDYHVPQGAVARCAHRAIYAPDLDAGWQAWTDIDQKPVQQLSFANFLEEHLRDVVEPAGAKVLETVASLKAKKNVEFESGVELQSGAIQFVHKETVEGQGKGEVEIPAQFELGLPIFFNGPAYKMTCLLRYRIQEGKLFFIVKIHQREALVRDALGEIVERIQAETGLAVHFGHGV